MVTGLLRRFRGLFWKFARVGELRQMLGLSVRWWSPAKKHELFLAAGERLSPWVGVCCVAMGITIFLF